MMTSGTPARQLVAEVDLLDQIRNLRSTTGATVEFSPTCAAPNKGATWDGERREREAHGGEESSSVGIVCSPPPGVPLYL